jgi:integrase
MNRINITDRTVAALKPQNKDQYIRDAQIIGFGIKVTPKGRKIWFLEITLAKKTRRRTFGTYPELLSKQARALALDLKASLQKGNYPDIFKQDRKIEYVWQLTKHYSDLHLSTLRKGERAQMMIDNNIDPLFGNLKLTKVTKERIYRWMAKTDKTKSVQEHIIAYFRAAWTFALKHGEITLPNPMQGITFPKHNIRAKVFNDHEKRIFLEKLEEFKTIDKSPFHALVLKLLYYTGYRLSEIRLLRIDQIDLNMLTATFTEHKTRERTDRDKVLNLSSKAMGVISEALEHRKRLNLDKTPWLFPSADKWGNVSGEAVSEPMVRSAWYKITEMAGLNGFTIHNLRSNWISRCVSIGMTVDQIAAQTGQSPVTIRKYYVTTVPDTLRSDAEKIAEVL